MVQHYGIADILARVLAGRQVDLEEVESFLEPKLRDLMPDPSVMQDMEKAAERLAQAVVAREKVAIFGDYDVDGACSTALLADYLRQAQVPYITYIPDRLTEGYGPNSEAVRNLAGQGAKLLVMVDCGTSGHEPVSEARRLGLDVVILDHHQAPVELPDANALVNPNRQDDLSGLGYLCAAGVVFVFLVALNRNLRQKGFWQAGHEPNLMGALDLVALATVADVVPLKGLNRAFVRQGLSVMRSRSRPGLAALADAAGLKDAPEAWHLGYLIGPRINAGGRIGDAGLGTRLLLTEEPENAGRLAGELDILNRERQQIEQLAVEEAMASSEHYLQQHPQTTLLLNYAPEWHAGIVGLVAARVKERFRLPSFAFTLSGEEQVTGSGRSVAGYDIGAAVRASVDAGIAIKGGGHAMAAGVTVPLARLEEFRAFIAGYLSTHGSDDGQGEALEVDAILTAGGATPELLKLVQKAGPFGSSQPEPVFAFTNHRLVEAREVGSSGHIRIKLRSGDGTTIGGIVFRAAGQPLGIALQKNIGELVHAAGTLSIDRWGGNEKADLRLIDIARP
ncbi:single-stranded-DNA-specific exonuclease RecJ [Microvirga sp. W0021]|uniref:Single-stranded-DNA-specific exonuclease RecJ n=2 Tax=Hohaiivirga grylli TaxID=3133970 RepID=A0ABV0BJ10_9HYPH